MPDRFPSVPSRVRAIAPPFFDLLNARADALRQQGATLINLGQALPGFSPPPSALTAARRAVDDTATHVYSADAGLPALRLAIARSLGSRHACDVPRESVVVTAGANQAFVLALQTLLTPGDEVLMPSPYFVNHAMAVEAVGGVVVDIPQPSGGTSINWTVFAPHLTPRTRALVLCNPANPTGATVSREALQQIVEECDAKGLLVFSDETYMEFVLDGSHASLAAVDGWQRVGVVVGSYSKCFAMTGWRVGFMLAHRDVVTEAEKIQDASLICAPVISQIAVEAALTEQPDWAAGFHPELRARRAALARLVDALPDLKWTPQPGGFFAFLKLPPSVSSMDTADRLLHEAHVITVPGSVFGRGGEGHLRVSFGVADVPVLEAAVRRMRRVLRS